MRRLGATLLLAAVLLVMLGSVRPADLVLSILVGAGVVALFGHGGTGGRFRIGGLPLLVAGTLLELLRGGWKTLRVLTGRDPWENVGNLEVPFGERSDLGAKITGLIATATPGSVLIDIDWENRTMSFNLIDASDMDEGRAQLDGFYRRYQRRAVP